MTLELILTKDDGTTEVLASGPPQIPLQWKSILNQPIIVLRGTDNGAYKIYSITVQPTVVLEIGYGKPPNPNNYKVF